MPGARPAALAVTLIVAGVVLAEGMAKSQSVPLVETVKPVGAVLVNRIDWASKRVPEKLSWLGSVASVAKLRMVIVTGIDRGLFRAVNEVIVMEPV